MFIVRGKLIRRPRKQDNDASSLPLKKNVLVIFLFLEFQNI